MLRAERLCWSEQRNTRELCGDLTHLLWKQQNAQRGLTAHLLRVAHSKAQNSTRRSTGWAVRHIEASSTASPAP